MAGATDVSLLCTSSLFSLFASASAVADCCCWRRSCSHLKPDRSLSYGHSQILSQCNNNTASTHTHISLLTSYQFSLSLTAAQFNDAAAAADQVNFWLHLFVSIPHRLLSRVCERVEKSVCVCVWGKTGNEFPSLVSAPFSPHTPKRCNGADPLMLQPRNIFLFFWFPFRSHNLPPSPCNVFFFPCNPSL